MQQLLKQCKEKLSDSGFDLYVPLRGDERASVDHT